MKHLLFIAFALGLFTNSFGQDLLVTAKGDTMRCKILSQTDQQIFISTLQPDGTSVSSYVSKDTIQTITPGYFGNGDLVGTSLDSHQATTPRKKEKRHPKDGVRFAVSGGYSLGLGKLPKGASSKDRQGFAINGDLAGFFNDYIGLGAFINYRQFSEAQAYCWLGGAKLLARFYNHSKNSAMILGLGMGYASYKGKAWSYTAKGSTFGVTSEIGYEAGISKEVALLFNLSATITTIGNIKIKEQLINLEHRASLNSINLTIGIVFGR